MANTKRKTVYLDETQCEKTVELAKALGTSERTAFRKILDSGFRYWFPDTFGRLESANALQEKVTDDFYEAFARGFDRSGLAESARARAREWEFANSALAYLVVAAIAYSAGLEGEDGGPDMAAAGTLVESARAYADLAIDPDNRDRAFSEIVSGMGKRRRRVTRDTGASRIEETRGEDGYSGIWPERMRELQEIERRLTDAARQRVKRDMDSFDYTFWEALDMDLRVGEISEDGDIA